MGTTYSITFNGVLEASLGTVTPGQCACLDTTGNFYVVSTIGNRGTQRTRGVITLLAVGGKACQIQSDGICDRSITQIPFLAVGSGGRSNIRVNAGGNLERADPPAVGDEIVGWCDEFGNALLSFGGAASSLIGTLAGDVTGPPGSNLITAFNSIPFAANSPNTGDVLSYQSGVVGWVPAVGDAFGPITSLTVARIQGIGVSGITPTTGQVLAYNGTVWIATTPSATTSVTMGGDVTGPSSAAVVERIHGATVPIAGSLVTGNSLHVSGASALSYSALNLAGGSGWVTGVLPVGNLPAMGGDVLGTIAANRVTTISGATAGNVVTVTSGVTFAFPVGILSAPSTSLEWTGARGFLVNPFVNQTALFGSISTTLSGVWFGSTATTTPTSGNFAMLYTASTDRLSFRGGIGIELIATSGVEVFAPSLSFGMGQATPIIGQDSANSGSAGTTLTVTAQPNVGAGPGGNLLLSGGTSLSGGQGGLTLQAGVLGTTVDTSLMSWTATKTPLITQVLTSSSGTAATFTLQGQQNNGSGFGGDLSLSGGGSFIAGQSGKVVLTGREVDVITDTMRWDKGYSPIITQEDQAGSTACRDFILRAQSTGGTQATGGNLILRTGAGFLNSGSMLLETTPGLTGIQIYESVSASNRHIILNLWAPLSSQLGLNSGEGTIFVGFSTVNPSANPVGGYQLYADPTQGLFCLSPSGAVTQLAPP